MDSPFSLGVVIPCHKPYIPFLGQCLDSIEFQSVKPDKVVVVCSSSTPDDIPSSYRDYSFPITIITREDARNQAQNRNEGLSIIGTDVVSFFDADDLMHPHRIQYLRTYMPHTDFIAHAFVTEGPFRVIRNPTVHLNRLMRGPSGCVQFNPFRNAIIHHAHVTVRADLLKTFTFDESNTVAGVNEDCLFCGDIVGSGARTIYIEEPLSWYRLRSS
jgi:glycosyltransferase involved in cell wall biosynthesis